MKSINIKSAIISATLIWTLGVIAYVTSYLVPVMSDPDVQANWVLSIAIIPIAALGAHIYYRKGHQTNGLVLGASMFLVAIILDAIITVPVFIIPNRGNHITFFTDSGFWLIAMEYIAVVAAYRQIVKSLKTIRTNKV